MSKYQFSKPQDPEESIRHFFEVLPTWALGDLLLIVSLGQGCGKITGLTKSWLAYHPAMLKGTVERGVMALFIKKRQGKLGAHQERISAILSEHIVDPAFARRLWKQLVSGQVRKQLNVAPGDNDLLDWLRDQIPELGTNITEQL